MKYSNIKIYMFWSCQYNLISYNIFTTVVAVWPSQETFSPLNPSVPLSAVWSLNQQWGLDVD